MSRTCPNCGYSPIGPFSDNCPICAEPVRNVPSGGGGGGRSGLANLPPLLVGGWLVIGLALAFLFWGDWLWLLLSLVLCGAAWWALAQADTLLLRLLGGSLLVLFVPGLLLAAQPTILPGLDQREMSPERIMRDMMAAMRGTSPESLRMSARMKSISGIIYAVHVLVAVPLALLVPPLLNYRRRRRLGGPIVLTKPQAIAGLAVWLLLLPAIGWLAWPTMQSWAETPNSFPRGWPGVMPPQQED